MPGAPFGAEMRHSQSVGRSPVEHLTELIYELLDAHADTTRLATDPCDDPGWEAHLDYLRDLQRVGREVMAGVNRD